MRWELSEEQEMFTEALDGWLGRFAAPANVRKWGEWEILPNSSRNSSRRAGSPPVSTRKSVVRAVVCSNWPWLEALGRYAAP